MQRARPRRNEHDGLAPPHVASRNATAPRYHTGVQTLTTPRLVLRPIALDDVDALWPYASDPSLPRYMSWNAHASKDETRAWIQATLAERDAGTCLVWAIVHDGAAAGTITLDEITRTIRALRVDEATLGYWLAPPLHGQGLMTEAGRAVVAHGFDALGLHKISVGCFAENAGSRRVIKKLGFRYLCTRRAHFWKDGAWHDHHEFELLAEEHRG